MDGQREREREIKIISKININIVSNMILNFNRPINQKNNIIFYFYFYFFFLLKLNHSKMIIQMKNKFVFSFIMKNINIYQMKYLYKINLFFLFCFNEENKKNLMYF